MRLSFRKSSVLVMRTFSWICVNVIEYQVLNSIKFNRNTTSYTDNHTVSSFSTMKLKGGMLNVILYFNTLPVNIRRSIMSTVSSFRFPGTYSKFDLTCSAYLEIWKAEYYRSFHRVLHELPHLTIRSLNDPHCWKVHCLALAEW